MSTTETSAQLRAQMEQVRDHVAQLRAEEHAVLAAAQAEAERLRAEADRVLTAGRTEASRLSREASNAEYQIDPIEKRMLLVQAAEELETGIPTAEARIIELVNEIEALGETVDALDQRLEQHGVEREEIGVQLAAMREAGDVDGVLHARQRMSAIDEVVQALTGQRDTANERIRVIGTPDGDGELAAVDRLTASLHATQRQVLNQLDPERYEAQVDAAIGAVRSYVTWQAELQQEQNDQGARRRNTIVQN